MDEKAAPIIQEKGCKKISSAFHIVAEAKIKPINKEYIDLICHPPE